MRELNIYRRQATAGLHYYCTAKILCLGLGSLLSLCKSRARNSGKSYGSMRTAKQDFIIVYKLLCTTVGKICYTEAMKMMKNIEYRASTS